MKFKIISSPVFRALLICSSFLTLSQFSLADETAEHKLREFKLGEHVSGPKVRLSSLRGKVVVIDYWGVNCPPCLALMPHIASLDKRNAKKGLVMIAAESQGSSVEKIEKITEKNDLECCVVKGVSGPNLSNGLPHMAIFNTSGDMVWNGRPGDESDRIIKKELRKAKELLAGETEKKSSSNKLIKMRTWENTEGKKMQASLRSVEDGVAVFVSKRGRKFEYSLDKLSESDQQLIAETQKEKL